MATYGIDLGTTYSCIAYVDSTGRPVVLKSANGEDTTPSVVYFESPDSVVVGRTAKDSAIELPRVFWTGNLRRSSISSAVIDDSALCRGWLIAKGESSM